MIRPAGPMDRGDRPLGHRGRLVAEAGVAGRRGELGVSSLRVMVCRRPIGLISGAAPRHLRCRGAPRRCGPRRRSQHCSRRTSLQAGGCGRRRRGAPRTATNVSPPGVGEDVPVDAAAWLSNARTVTEGDSSSASLKSVGFWMGASRSSSPSSTSCMTSIVVQTFVIDPI